MRIRTALLCFAAAGAAALVLPCRVAARQPLPLDTLHVNAGARALPGAAARTRSVEVLDRAALERLPALTLADILARGLGVDVQARSPASADLSLRGASFEQVLVLVDGVPLRDGQTGHFHLDLAVPLESIERIEIVRGGASPLYGSHAVGGTVNIITTTDAPPRLRLEAGSFGTVAGGGRIDRPAGSGRAHFAADASRSDGHRTGTGYEVLQLRGGINHRLGGGTLRGDAAWAARDFGAADFYAPFDSREATRIATLTLSWAPPPDARLAVAPRLVHRRHDDDFILLRNDPDFYRNEHFARQWGAEIVTRAAIARGLSIAAGGEAWIDGLASESLGTRRESHGALHAELSIDRARAVATAGIRADRHSSFGTHVSPALAVGVRPSARVQARASATSGYRAPNWTERFYRDPANVGNPDLDAERFVAGEIGVVAMPLERIVFDAAFFVRRAEGMIDWGRPSDAPAAAEWRTMNIDDARVRGVEFRADALSTGTTRLTARFTHTRIRASSAADFESKYALNPLTRAASLAFATTLSRIALSGDAGHRRRADGVTWWQVDGRLQLPLGGLAAHLDVVNLFDERPLDGTGRPAAGRAFRAGLRTR